jgi:hypothetical protein
MSTTYRTLFLLSWFQWHIFIHPGFTLLDKPFQDETRTRRASNLPAMASPPLKRIKSGVHRWVIISKLVGVAICKFVIMYGDHRPPNWFDAQLIPAGERIGDQFDEGIDKARPDGTVGPAGSSFFGADRQSG